MHTTTKNFYTPYNQCTRPIDTKCPIGKCIVEWPITRPDRREFFEWYDVGSSSVDGNSTITHSTFVVVGDVNDDHCRETNVMVRCCCWWARVPTVMSRGRCWSSSSSSVQRMSGSNVGWGTTPFVVVDTVLVRTLDGPDTRVYPS